MAKEAIIRIKGDSSHYENVLRRTKKTSQDSFQSIMGYAKAYLSVQAAKELLLFSGKVDTVSRTFKSLATSYGKSSNELLQAVKKASRGTISELSIMESANSAMQLMGQDVIKMLPEMAEIATKTARAQGVSAEQMLSDIVTASGRQSTMILDNLGISSVQAGQYMEEYAAKLGKTRQQLTDSERSAAFFYATLKAGGEIAARSGDDTLTLGEKIQKLFSSIKDLGTNLVTAMGPALNYLIDKVNQLIDKVGELTSRLSQDRAKIEGINNFLGKNQQTILSYEKQYQELQKSGAYRDTQEGQDRLADVTNKLRQLYALRDAARKELNEIDKGISKASPIITPNVPSSNANPEAAKHKEAKASMTDYYERLGQYQNAAQQKEYEAYQSFLATQEGKTALAYNQAALEEEFANRKLLADVAGAQQEVALKEQVIRAKLGLESTAFQGAQMFANAGAQLMSSQNKKLFKLGQVASIANVWMNTAQAITKGYAQLGAFGGTAFAALMGTVAGVQTQNIMKQKPPGDMKNESASIAAPELPKYNIVPLAQGVFDVPKDMPAVIHKGESVMPKSWAESVRGGELGAMGTTIVVQGNIIDTEGLLQAVHKANSEIAKRTGTTIYSR